MPQRNNNKINKRLESDTSSMYLDTSSMYLDTKLKHLEPDTQTMESSNWRKENMLESDTSTTYMFHYFFISTCMKILQSLGVIWKIKQSTI